MDINLPNQETTSQANIGRCACGFIKSMPGKFKSTLTETVKEAKKIGKDDPRRIVHCVKVGLALTLVSLLYYCRPLYDSFGQSGMWAILTVVVVFEYTVGGTLSKSLNRGCATLVAGALGVGAEYLANLCGEKGEPVILGLLVFFLAAASTFTRFFPKVKRKYDYGVLIFILTFNLVAVSGFRVTQILQLAHQRLSTILIGGATCMMISIFVCPVWAGQDLHNTIAGNIEKLAVFLEGFGDELCSFSGKECIVASSKHYDEKLFLQSHRSVLNSKASEESLANFAWWELHHGRFKFRHPWQQYLKIGAQARECAYLIETLYRFINSNSQVKVTSELQVKIQQTCIRLSLESGKALRELSSTMKNMTTPSSDVEIHAQNCKLELEDLSDILEKFNLPTEANLQEIMPLLIIASVLIDIIKCVDKIALSTHELSQKAHFQKPKETLRKQHRAIVKPIDDQDHVIVEIHDSPEDLPENKNIHLSSIGESSQSKK